MRSVLPTAARAGSVSRPVALACTVRASRTARRSTPFAALAGMLFAAALLLPPALLADAGGEAFARGGDRGGLWVGTWGASPQSPLEALFGPAPEPLVFEDRTIRTIARVSLGGGHVRVRFDNTFGSVPLVIDAASAGLHGGGGSLVEGSERPLSFGGQPTVTVPVGAPMLSDPVELHVPDLAELAVSVHLPGPTPGTSLHSLGQQTAYVSAPGEYTLNNHFPTEFTTEARYFLSGIEVRARRAEAIVTLGDSITDGFGSSVDANARWPDVLAARLVGSDAERGRRGRGARGVVNAGISGNRVLTTVIGPNALARFDRDVLAVPGVRFVTLLEGINDIGLGTLNPAEEKSADEIIQGYRQLIARAHSRCVKIIGATLTPFEGALYYKAEGEAKRQAVNDFIRHGGEFDAVIDFDAVVRDPEQPTRLLPEYDVGDQLHPSDAGYRAMGEAVDLRLFRHALRGCR